MTKVTDLLEQAFIEYGLTTKSSKHLIVQRDNERFWPVIFRQTFDLSKVELNVRFSGEADSENGRPFREFLCVKHRQSLFCSWSVGRIVCIKNQSWSKMHTPSSRSRCLISNNH